MKRHKKIVKRALLIICCFIIAGLILYVGVNIHVRHFAEEYIYSEEEINNLSDLDCIIVLGAGVRPDGSPSHMLESRLNMGIRLYENNISEKFLLSGDHGRKNYDEVNNMMNFILENTDIDRKDIFLDHAGFSTYESGYRAKAIFKVEKAVIVTQKYHLYRAIYTARKNGVEAFGVASDDRDWPGILIHKFRESLAIFKDFWYCVFNIKPTYLGEAIPVSGSGILTHDIVD